MKKDSIRNVTIIGSGPAGWSAAIYAARDMLKPLVICGEDPGGQLMVTTAVENYPGFADPIAGSALMQSMQKHAEMYGTEVMHEYVEKVDFTTAPFKMYTKSGKEILSKTVIICTGAYAKWLGIESETEFKGYGVSGCAVCDGFFFKDKRVCVVGGGNTAMEEALHLAKFATAVTMLVRGDSLKGEQILRSRVLNESKINLNYSTELVEIQGTNNNQSKAVKGIKMKNSSGEITTQELEGVFIAIGHAPNSGIFSNYIKMDEKGYIITAADSTETNIAGVFAAGDVQDFRFRQAVTAAGTGCMAALEAASYLSSK